MATLLRITAAVSLAWAVLLFGLDGLGLMPAPLSVLERALANGLAIANLAFALLFWSAARQPAANRSALYAALLLLVLKTANDLYELLILLPGDQALVSLGDLVVSVALLVGILEALPRTLRAEPADS